MKPRRISFFVQQIAFGLALATPLSLLVGSPVVETLFCTGYMWSVGLTAALWHRGTVAE